MTLEPWLSEPDRIEFEHAGLPCLTRRNKRMGHWCGYVAVPPGHPLHGKHDEEADGLPVHGGITYAAHCDGEEDGICHKAKPGESDDVWWFGFDFAHGGDLIPSMSTTRPDHWRDMLKEHYWTADEVRAECEQLAELLSLMPSMVTPS